MLVLRVNISGIPRPTWEVSLGTSRMVNVCTGAYSISTNNRPPSFPRFNGRCESCRRYIGPPRFTEDDAHRDVEAHVRIDGLGEPEVLWVWSPSTMTVVRAAVRRSELLGLDPFDVLLQN